MFHFCQRIVQEMFASRNSHLMRKCNQQFVSGLYSSRHLFFASDIQKLVDRWDKYLNEFDGTNIALT